MCSLASFQKEPPPGRAGGAHFTPQPGAVWSHFSPAPSPAHSCWLTHRWVTQSPLLVQGLAGGRGRQGHAMLRAAFLLSTTAQHWIGRSSPWSNTCCTHKFDCHSSGLWTIRVFLKQFINFLFAFPHMHSLVFCFISHHPSTQLPHLCSLPSPGPSHSYQFPFLSHHQYSYTSPLPPPGFHCLLDPSFNHLSYHRGVQLEPTSY